MAEARITEQQLADLLRGFYLTVRQDTGKIHGQVDDPRDVANAVFRQLSANQAHEPHPTGPRLQDADLCARCGNQFKPGQVCDSCREGDPEVAAMAAIVTVMDELDEHAILLGEDVHERVIRWAMARWRCEAHRA